MISKEGITKDAIGKSYEDIKIFNDVASNLSGDKQKLKDRINNQLGYIFSELTEAIDGFEAKDAKELLDGACDTWVTVAGLLQILEAAGFDVATAIAKVDANNLSKFPVRGMPLQFSAEFRASLNDKYGRYVIKDETGKVRKPSDFVPVDLSDCVPENFFKD